MIELAMIRPFDAARACSTVRRGTFCRSGSERYHSSISACMFWEPASRASSRHCSKRPVSLMRSRASHRLILRIKACTPFSGFRPVLSLILLSACQNSKSRISSPRALAFDMTM